MCDAHDDMLRLMPCSMCGTEGVLIYARGNNPDHEREEECPVCEGCRCELVEIEPIEIDDLDIMSGPITTEDTAT